VVEKQEYRNCPHANVAPTDVAQLSGHKNFQSLNSYSKVSINQQKNMSHILSVTKNNIPPVPDANDYSMCEEID
jgi:hypothetical protein